MFFIPHKGQVFRILVNLHNWQRYILLFCTMFFCLWLLYKFDKNSEQLPHDRFKNAHEKLYYKKTIQDISGSSH